MGRNIKQQISEQDKKRESDGQKCLDRARKTHLESAGAPSLAPTHDDAVKEKAVTASKGSKSK